MERGFSRDFCGPAIHASLTILLKMQKNVAVSKTTLKLIDELVRVERNLTALAQAVGVTLPEVMAFVKGSALPNDDNDNDNDNNNRVAPLPLPKGLKHRVRNMEALEKALQLGYVVRLSDHWEWSAGSKTLLVYFAGRLLCGDYPRWCGGKELWMQGKGRLPEKELCELFGTSSLRTLRKNNFFSPLPEGHEIIDGLFDNE